MAYFRVHTSSTGETTTFASTNRWFRFALAWWESRAFPDQVGRDELSLSDALLPIELADATLDYPPAHTAMTSWAERFFSGHMPNGLLRSDVQQAGNIRFPSFDTPDFLDMWVATNATLGQDEDDSHVLYDDRSMSLTIAADGDATAEYRPDENVTDRTGADRNVTGIAVKERERYTGSIMAFPSTSPDDLRLQIRWFDGNGDPLAAPQEESRAFRDPWVRASVSGQAPDGAVRATFVVGIVGGRRSDRHYFDGALFERGGPFDYFTFPTQHQLIMLRRMTDFLGWFPAARPGDTIWLSACKSWADAVLDLHRVLTGHGDRHAWGLYRLVETQGANAGRSSDHGLTPSFFDGGNSKIHHLGWVTQALEALARHLESDGDASGAARYREFARRSSWAMWGDRGTWRPTLPPPTALLFDTVHSSSGPLYPDANPIRATVPAEEQDRYVFRTPEGNRDERVTHDTDCLYWARELYSIYGETQRLPQRDLVPLLDRIVPRFHDDGRPKRLALGLGTFNRSSAIRARRRLLDGFLSRRQPTSDGSIDRYLYMALAVTLDWMRGGWHEGGRHFVRKIYRIDGTRAVNIIYGDGSWNTLFVLVSAYQFTGDPFYLHELRMAWSTFRSTAEGVTNWWVNNEKGEWSDWIAWRQAQYRDTWLLDISGLDPLLPGRRHLFHGLRSGALDNHLQLMHQDPFIEVMLRAHEAVKEKRVRTDWFLNEAERLADLAMERYVCKDVPTTGGATYRMQPCVDQLAPGDIFSKAGTGPTLARLALAGSLLEHDRGKLRRVEFVVPAQAKLTFMFNHGPPRWEQSVDVHVEGTRAVVYMDPGSYTLHVSWEGATAITYREWRNVEVVSGVSSGSSSDPSRSASFSLVVHPTQP